MTGPCSFRIPPWQRRNREEMNSNQHVTEEKENTLKNQGVTGCQAAQGRGSVRLHPAQCPKIEREKKVSLGLMYWTMWEWYACFGVHT